MSKDGKRVNWSDKDTRGWNGSTFSWFGLYHDFRVTVSVRFGMFREKLYCQIKIKKIRIIYLTTSNSTNKYNRVKIQIK